MSQPPGWYDDGSGRTRWWNGVSWSEGARPPEQPHQSVPSQQQPHQQPGQPYVPGQQGQQPSASGQQPYAGQQPFTPGQHPYAGQQPFTPGQQPFTPGQQPYTGQQPFTPGQQYPGQQPFGAGAPPKRRSRRGLVIGIVVGVLALIALGIVGVVVFVRAVMGGTEGARQAVQDFNQAYAQHDCALMQDAVSVAAFEESFGTCADFEAQAMEFTDQLQGGAAGFAFRITSVDVVNSTGTVIASETYSYTDGTSETYEATYEVVRTNGEWVIDTWY